MNNYKANYKVNERYLIELTIKQSNALSFKSQMASFYNEKSVKIRLAVFIDWPINSDIINL